MEENREVQIPKKHTWIYAIVFILFLALLVLYSMKGKIIEWQLEKHYGMDLSVLEIEAVTATEAEPLYIHSQEEVTNGKYYIFLAQLADSTDQNMTGYATWFFKPIACTYENRYYSDNLAQMVDEAISEVMPIDDFVVLYNLNVERYPVADSYEEFSHIYDYSETYTGTIVTSEDFDDTLAYKINAALIRRELGGKFYIHYADQDVVLDLKDFGLITDRSDNAEDVRRYLMDKYSCDSMYDWHDTAFTGVLLSFRKRQQSIRK